MHVDDVECAATWGDPNRFRAKLEMRFGTVKMEYKSFKHTGIMYDQLGSYTETEEQIAFVRAQGVWKMRYVKHDFQWVEGNNALFEMMEPQLAAQMAHIFTADNIAAGAEVAV